MNLRENMLYRVDEEIKEFYEREIIFFWKGRVMRDIIFENLF